MTVKEMIEMMVRNIVGSPDEVTIHESGGVAVQVFEIECAKDDVGMVIGKSGRTIDAIRYLVCVRAQLHQCQTPIYVNVVEDK